MLWAEKMRQALGRIIPKRSENSFTVIPDATTFSLIKLPIEITAEKYVCTRKATTSKCGVELDKCDGLI